MIEEEKIGSDYIVNLTVNADLALSSETDKLEDTVDYVSLLAIVKKQMSIRSKLLENVVDRIINQVFNDLPKVNQKPSFGQSGHQMDLPKNDLCVPDLSGLYAQQAPHQNQSEQTYERRWLIFLNHVFFLHQ